MEDDAKVLEFITNTIRERQITHILFKTDVPEFYKSWIERNLKHVQCVVDDEQQPTQAIFCCGNDVDIKQLHEMGITVFEVSKRKVVNFTQNDMISVVFDIETVSVNKIKQKIPDQVVTIAFDAVK